MRPPAVELPVERQEIMDTIIQIHAPATPDEAAITAVFRFMSYDELAAFQRGEHVCSPYYGGSYFLPLFGEWGPSTAHDFLTGLVSEDVCAVFVAPSMVFEDRLAPYANPAYCSAWDDTIDVRELFAVGGYSAAAGFRFVGALPAPDYDRSPEGRRILHDAWVLQHADA